jgi:His/Glu/Gln/Arg/opine family amino acid ABC transporter permease subunit
MNIIKNIINIKNWTPNAKKTAIIIMAVLIVFSIFSSIRPSEEIMMDNASDTIKEIIEAEKDSSRKHLTITYNNLGIVSYLSFTTSGANSIKESYVGFAGNIFDANEGVGKFTGQMVNYIYRMLGINQNLLHGAKLTILLTTLSVLIGFAMSIPLALGKIAKNKLISRICGGYIFFFRGTPLLIQLFVVYFTIPGIFGFAWRNLFDITDPEAVYKGAFLAALISFSLNSAAYIAEIVRAAIQSIDKGQYEAARALGMKYRLTMTKIIIPQSFKRMIPPLCNEFIMMIKDVSLVFAISLMDITTISKTIMTSQGSYTVFIPALIIYLIITAFFTFLFNKLEEKLSIYE